MGAATAWLNKNVKCKLRLARLKLGYSVVAAHLPPMAEKAKSSPCAHMCAHMMPCEGPARSSAEGATGQHPARGGPFPRSHRGGALTEKSAMNSVSLCIATLINFNWQELNLGPPASVETVAVDALEAGEKNGKA